MRGGYRLATAAAVAALLFFTSARGGGVAAAAECQGATYLELAQNGQKAYDAADYKLAISCLTQALAWDPSKLGAKVLLGKSYCGAGDSDTALSRLQDAIDAPDSSNAKAKSTDDKWKDEARQLTDRINKSLDDCADREAKPQAATLKCDDNDVFCYDTCGAAVSKYESCGNGSTCSDGACLCKDGYVRKGHRCVRDEGTAPPESGVPRPGNPAQPCPEGYGFSGGECVKRSPGQPSIRANSCMGKVVTDLWSGEAANRGWPQGWMPVADMRTITDGDNGSGLTSGYGGWGGGKGASYNVQSALQTSPDGIPMLSIDMENEYKFQSFVVARPTQQPNEGDGGAVMAMSLWGSHNNKDWTRITDTFSLLPNASTELKYNGGDSFRYLRVNLHSLGLYTWKRKVNSQMGISEIQCYPK